MNYDNRSNGAKILALEERVARIAAWIGNRPEEPDLNLMAEAIEAMAENGLKLFARIEQLERENVALVSSLAAALEHCSDEDARTPGVCLVDDHAELHSLANTFLPRHRVIEVDDLLGNVVADCICVERDSHAP